MTAPLLAVTQRVDVIPRSVGAPERRDALDQAWPRFLAAAGFRAVPLPNHVATAFALLSALPICGLVLTGGNDLLAYGGDAPERDATEAALLGAARARALPVIGICRGMQLLQHAHGVSLSPVDGHVAKDQIVHADDADRTVNSFHRWGARSTSPELAVWARSEDGVVKAVRHVAEPIVGIMWHPERLAPFAPEDLALFRDHFAPARKLAA